MKRFIVTFGFNSDEGYVVHESKPILADNEQEACIELKDQFECSEGIECNIISSKEI